MGIWAIRASKVMRTAGILVSLESGAVAQETPEVRLAHQEAALRVIRETAASLCAEVRQAGAVTHTEAVAKAQVGLSGMFRRLVDVGVSGEVRRSRESFEGLAQRDLPAALQSGNNCNIQVLVTLQPVMLPTPVLARPQTPLSGGSAASPGSGSIRQDRPRSGAESAQPAVSRPASDAVILRVFPKNNITQRDVQALKAALPSYNVLIGNSAIDPRNPADVLFVNRDQVDTDAVVETMAALRRIGVFIKSVQQVSLSGRREIQVGTVVQRDDGEGSFQDEQPLDLSRLRTLRGVAFWREAFNGRAYCQVSVGFTRECRMTADARPIQ